MVRERGGAGAVAKGQQQRKRRKNQRVVKRVKRQPSKPARRQRLSRELVARPERPKEKLKYQSYFEFVDNEDRKKKLEHQVTKDRNPPPGFTFVPIGNPELTESCKEISREKGYLIFIVSGTQERQDDVGAHVHRRGYHFRSVVVEHAALTVGGIQDHGGGDDEPEPIPETQEEINKQAHDAIRDLYPRIPFVDSEQIVEHAFKKGGTFGGKPVVGTQADLTLSRRVQLAVLAHIRHQHTRYDQLLMETDWASARKAVEQLCLDTILKWRGDEETGRDQLDEIVREVVIIPDTDSESDSASTGDAAEDESESDSSDNDNVNDADFEDEEESDDVEERREASNPGTGRITSWATTQSAYDHRALRSSKYPQEIRSTQQVQRVYVDTPPAPRPYYEATSDPPHRQPPSHSVPQSHRLNPARATSVIHRVAPIVVDTASSSSYAAWRRQGMNRESKVIGRHPSPHYFNPVDSPAAYNREQSYDPRQPLLLPQHPSKETVLSSIESAPDRALSRNHASHDPRRLRISPALDQPAPQRGAYGPRPVIASRVHSSDQYERPSQGRVYLVEDAASRSIQPLAGYIRPASSGLFCAPGTRQNQRGPEGQSRNSILSSRRPPLQPEDSPGNSTAVVPSYASGNPSRFEDRYIARHVGERSQPILPTQGGRRDVVLQTHPYIPEVRTHPNTPTQGCYVDRSQPSAPAFHRSYVVTEPAGVRHTEPVLHPSEDLSGSRRLLTRAAPESSYHQNQAGRYAAENLPFGAIYRRPDYTSQVSVESRPRPVYRSSTNEALAVPYRAIRRIQHEPESIRPEYGKSSTSVINRPVFMRPVSLESDVDMHD